MTEKNKGAGTTNIKSYSSFFWLFIGLVLLALGYYLNAKGADAAVVREGDAVSLSIYLVFGKFSYFYAGIFSLISVGSFIWRLIARKETAAAGERKSLSDLQALSWKEFRDYIKCLFLQLGYSVDGNGGLSDENSDLKLKRKTGISLVSCKKYYVRRIPASMVFEFYTAMIRERSIERGYFISTGTFTQEARRFAEDKPLVLIDGDGLMDLVRIAESVDVSQERSKIHDNPNRTDYSCPTCSTRMLLRTMKGDPNGDQFWICSAYPACNGFLRKEGRGPLYFGY